MKDYIEDRVYEIANYIVETGVTVRAAAKTFAVSKSTVHKDVSERLMELDMTLYKQVKKITDINLAERHIRGGLATKEKYTKTK